MMYRVRKEVYWVILILVAGLVLYQAAVAREEAEFNRAQQQQIHDEQIRQLHELENTVKELNERTNQVQERLEDFMEMFKVEEVEITGYAPLDPKAIEGLCYSGDPGVTASGEPTQIGITVAAGPDIPFGTRVWIDGFGWRRAEDTGGAIRGERLDIYMASRSDAMNYGRQKVIVVWPSD